MRNIFSLLLALIISFFSQLANSAPQSGTTTDLFLNILAYGKNVPDNLTINYKDVSGIIQPAAPQSLVHLAPNTNTETITPIFDNQYICNINLIFYPTPQFKITNISNKYYCIQNSPTTPARFLKEGNIYFLSVAITSL